MQERLQKILSAAGVCSRRQAEEYLRQGRVTVNGLAAGLGDKADPDVDAVSVDGKPITKPEVLTYLMLHKPRGYITTLSDENGRPTVADLVRDCPVRVWPVGRLDWDSEGLLLLTNDGDLTNRLIHPSPEGEEEYIVTVPGDFAAAGLEVTRLKRVREGALTLGDLPRGRWRELTAAEVAGLKA